MNGETPMSAEPQHQILPDTGTPHAPLAADSIGADAPAQVREGILDLPQPFRLLGGAIVREARLAWRCAGPADAPLIVALGGISAHRSVASGAGQTGWWAEQCGPKRTLDTRRYQVLAIDWLGGCGESTRAAELGTPAAARRSRALCSLALADVHDMTESLVSTADQAHALLALLNRLGVRRVHLLVGASYGGNVAQHLAALLGVRLRRLVLLSAAHRPAQFGVALRHIQRSILDLGADNDRALALARELAVLCYRTTEGVEERFGHDDTSAGQELQCLEGHGRPKRAGGVVGWLAHHGATFSARFDAQAYRCLGRSLDSHAIDPAAIRVPTTLFAVREDLTVPLSLLREYAVRAGAGCELVEIFSPYGHDAFLKETAAVSRILAGALEVSP
jgi:homoserine O-acetyltransferase